jgi:hypothetical protein
MAYAYGGGRVAVSGVAHVGDGESAPLLGPAQEGRRNRRGLMREIWCGVLDPDEAGVLESAGSVNHDVEASQNGEAGEEARAGLGEPLRQLTAAQVNSWARGWKRFWRPVGRKEYWRAVLHLVLLNFPFVSLLLSQSISPIESHRRWCK